VHFDVIKSFICPNNAQLNCFKMLKFTLGFTINDNIKTHGATVEIIEAQHAKLCTTYKNTKVKGAFIVNLNVKF
jgi:hypothetical protein